VPFSGSWLCVRALGSGAAAKDRFAAGRRVLPEWFRRCHDELW